MASNSIVHPPHRIKMLRDSLTLLLRASTEMVEAGLPLPSHLRQVLGGLWAQIDLMEGQPEKSL